MNNISFNTRNESHNEIKNKKQKRYNEILDILIKGRKTAKEIAIELFNERKIPTSERNFTAPRLTELEQMGYVEVEEKKKDSWSGKQVAVYEITPDGIENRFNNHIPRID